VGIIIIIIINNVYYYGGAITKLCAAGPPYSVKSCNNKLAYTSTLHDSKYAGEDAHVSWQEMMT